MESRFTSAQFRAAADYILDRTGARPDVALVLGSALGGLAEEIESPVVIDYRDIPHFLVSTVESHAGKLICGTLAGRRVVCMSGRFHFYEGYDFEELVAPIRVFKCLGVRMTVLTNAAGAINESYRPGDIMVVRDHIKLMGASPLRGPNLADFGPRFFDVGDMYTAKLRALAHEAAAAVGLSLREGVYFFAPGPQFETPAEIRAMRLLGGDAVGMSTVTEALTAAHCGMPLLALSLMTNMAAGILDRPLTTEEVDEVGLAVSERFRALIREIVARSEA